MAGDQPQICMDPKQVSFMYSYPNYIPLNGAQIRRVMECLEPLAYDRVYGAFFIRGKGDHSEQGEGRCAAVGRSVFAGDRGEKWEVRTAGRRCCRRSRGPSQFNWSIIADPPILVHIA